MKESQIQRAILEYLAATGVLAFRMNTGAMAGEYNGKTRFMRFGVVGMADILAFPVDYLSQEDGRYFRFTIPLWLEVKTATGKQSEYQKSFQVQVEAQGHRYAVVRSVDDVIQLLGSL